MKAAVLLLALSTVGAFAQSAPAKPYYDVDTQMFNQKNPEMPKPIHRRIVIHWQKRNEIFEEILESLRNGKFQNWRHPAPGGEREFLFEWDVQSQKPGQSTQERIGLPKKDGIVLENMTKDEAIYLLANELARQMIQEESEAK